jgi:plasmid maintenance system antidote protein VapI
MGAQGELNGSAKLTAQDVLKLRESYGAGSTANELAATFSISVSAVERIVTGFSWKHLTGGVNLSRIEHARRTSVQRKLSWQQVQLLRQVAPFTALSQRKWGVLLGVDQRTISNILSGSLYTKEES